MITALLKRVEDLYNAVLGIITGGGYTGLMSHWVETVLGVCIAVFVIDQVIWLFRYKPYKRWARMIRNFNRGADYVLDAILLLMEKAGLKRVSQQRETAPEAPLLHNAVAVALPDTAGKREGDTLVPAPRKPIPPPKEQSAGDWTDIPPSYEGVRWWE